jgi:hypothetical protein
VIPAHCNCRSVPLLHDGARARTNFLFLDTIDKSMYFTWGVGVGAMAGGALFHIPVQVIGYSLSAYVSPQLPLHRANMCHHAFQWILYNVSRNQPHRLIKTVNIRKSAGVGGSVRKCRPIVTVSSLWRCNSKNNTEGYKLMTKKSGSNLSHSLTGGWD